MFSTLCVGHWKSERKALSESYINESASGKNDESRNHFSTSKKKVLTVKGHTLMQVLLNKKQGYFMYNDENTLEINRRMIIRFHK